MAPIDGPSGVVATTDAFFAALRDVGYQGFLSLEFENDIYLNNVCDGDWSVAAVKLRERLDGFLPK